jgi:hypothetical protein
MNNAKPKDFTINIEGVGDFRFNRRTYGGQVKIDTEFARITAGIENIDGAVTAHANVISLYNALMVSCPPGWERLEDVDLTDTPELENKIFDLYVAVRDKLDSFRIAGKAVEGGQGAGGGDVAHDGVLDPAQVPAAA